VGGHLERREPCTSPRLTRLVDVRVDCGLVQRIDEGHVRGTARRLDLLGDRLQWLAGPAGQEHLRPVPGERASYGAANVSAIALFPFDRVLMSVPLLGLTSVRRARPERAGNSAVHP